jgi:hypothetical protein
LPYANQGTDTISEVLVDEVGAYNEVTLQSTTIRDELASPNPLSSWLEGNRFAKLITRHFTYSIYSGPRGGFGRLVLGD